MNAARNKHWYLAGAVPDTMDGRFALLATIVALVILRIERDGDEGIAGSVGVTEAFIADMDAQMRQQGFDATLSKQVRQLVGSLASRVDQWRRLIDEGGEWQPVVRRGVYRDAAPATLALDHSTQALRGLWQRLGDNSLQAVVSGQFE